MLDSSQGMVLSGKMLCDSPAPQSDHVNTGISERL